MNPVVVIGGGPAGASAALGLLRRGAKVDLYERRARWTGRVCGAFLSPEAAGHLDWLGLMDGLRAAGAAPVRAVRVTSAWGFDRTLPLAAEGLAFPRKGLEDLLLSEVARAGGRVFRGQAAPAGDGPRVLAAGRFGGEAPPKTGEGWYGWNAVFQAGQTVPGALSLHFDAGLYVGALAFADGALNVSGLLYKDGTAPWEEVFQGALHRLPALRAVLDGAKRLTDWIGAGPLLHDRRSAFTPGVFPVGDAAAVGDPFLGEGIGRALAAGPMLFDAWAESDPWEAYRRAWDRAFRGRLRADGWLRRVLRRPVLLKAALPLLCRRPMLSLFPHLRPSSA